jgi:hypothetical protein
MRTYSSIDQIRQHNAAIGQYFFSSGAMRFFSSRIGREVIGGRYFITSEQFDYNSPRLYTIRECIDGKVEQVSEFQEYKSGRAARAAARKLAA